MLRWYVVQVKPKHEDIALENLENQRFKCFYPQICEQVKRRGLVLNTPMPLFPLYMFVAFDMEHDRWRAIAGTRGVAKLLGSREDYASPIPVGFVEDLMRRINPEGYLSLMSTEKVLRKYLPGDVLRVKDGPFEGFTGACISIRKNYATLLLSLLSGSVEIKLPLNSVSHT